MLIANRVALAGSKTREKILFLQFWVLRAERSISNQEMEVERMGNVNRKAEDSKMEHMRRVIGEVYREYAVVFGGARMAGIGRRGIIRFRLGCGRKYRSNVVWAMPEELSRLTAQRVREMVAAANGRREGKRRRG